MVSDLIVFRTPIFPKPCDAEEVTAGIPAAFIFGLVSFKPARSGGVRARDGFRMELLSASGEHTLLNPFPVNDRGEAQ